MKYATLGHNGPEISRIAFGCMSLSGTEVSDIQLLHQAMDAGITLFDTADIYQEGKNEELVGKAFAGKRDRVLIATKGGNQPRKDGKGWDWNPKKEYLLTAVEASLKRLQTDYIDLYQLHGGTMEDNIEETIDAFETLKQAGKIRYYGISSIRPNVIREYVKRSGICSVMMQYSLLDRRPEETCLPLLQESGIGVLARGSVAKGLLINKAAAPYLNYSAEEVAMVAEMVSDLSLGGRGATQTALWQVLQTEGITAAVAGIRTAEQLAEAVKTFDTPSLTSDELAILKEVVEPAIYEQHR